MLVEHLLLNLRLESSVNLYISKTLKIEEELKTLLESSVNLYISKTETRRAGTSTCLRVV